jgi:outer membrane protein
MKSRIATAVFACLSAFAIAPTALAAQDMKIGVVDFQRAMREVDEGAAAQKALKKEFDEKQKQLDLKQTELKTLKDELDARGAMMKPEVKQQKVEDLQKKLMETQQMYMTLQQDLSKREAEAASEILKKMGVIVQTMGGEQSFTIIVDRSAVLYSKEALDLTNELIRRYNEAYGKKKTK